MILNEILKCKGIFGKKSLISLCNPCEISKRLKFRFQTAINCIELKVSEIASCAISIFSANFVADRLANQRVYANEN